MLGAAAKGVSLNCGHPSCHQAAAGSCRGQGLGFCVQGLGVRGWGLGLGPQQPGAGLLLGVCSCCGLGPVGVIGGLRELLRTGGQVLRCAAGSYPWAAKAQNKAGCRACPSLRRAAASSARAVWSGRCTAAAHQRLCDLMDPMRLHSGLQQAAVGPALGSGFSPEPC